MQLLRRMQPRLRGRYLMAIQTDLAPDRRSALELRLLERGEFGLVAQAYEAGAVAIQDDTKLTPAQRTKRWVDQMTTAAVLRGRV